VKFFFLGEGVGFTSFPKNRATERKNMILPEGIKLGGETAWGREGAVINGVACWGGLF